MMRTAAGIVLGLLFLTCSGAAVAQTGPPLEQYLTGPRGPYRGRVLDAETGKPLAGVVVVAVWRRDRIMPFHSRSEHYTARETLTNTNGDFVIDAGDVERNAPKRTLRPFFTIFLPGYGRPRIPAGIHTTVTQRFYEGPDDTVELPRLNTREERREYVGILDPFALSDAPFKEIPTFMRLLNQESVAVGLQPLEPVGK